MGINLLNRVMGNIVGIFHVGIVRDGVLNDGGVVQSHVTESGEYTVVVRTDLVVTTLVHSRLPDLLKFREINKMGL